MKLRLIAHVGFGFFLSVSAAYCSARIAQAFGLDNDWAGVIAGVTFGIAIVYVDKLETGR